MHRRSVAALLAALTCLSTLFGAGPVAAAPPVIPMPNEPILTDAERHLAVAGMSPRERGAIGPLLADGAPGLAVSYVRRQYRIDLTPDGRRVPVEVAPALGAEGSALSVPAEAVAAYATKPGTDLTISLTIMRTRSSSPYEWLVAPYAEWSGSDGLQKNSSADSMAVAWAGAAYLDRQTGDGQRAKGWPCNGSRLDIWPSDGSPNTGTAWSFHEFGWWGCRVWWAGADIRIRQVGWRGRTDNVVYKYYHTYTGRQYSYSFSRSPGITVTPTNDQWALAVFGAYAH